MRPKLDLRQIDLNLLLVFEAVYRTRNTTRAGEVLHLTQPAVSNALKRLRDVFDDVLFVKTANGMQPTPRADARLATSASEISTLFARRADGLGAFALRRLVGGN